MDTPPGHILGRASPGTWMEVKWFTSPRLLANHAD